jgi:putative membrane protein
MAMPHAAQWNQAASQLLITFVLGGVAMILTERFVSGFRIRGGFGTAVVAGVVYGGLHAVLQGILVLLSLPLVVMTFGLFIFVVNGCLLWLTAKLVPRVSFRSFGSLVAASFVLAVIDVVFNAVFRHSALF